MSSNKPLWKSNFSTLNPLPPNSSPSRHQSTTYNPNQDGAWEFYYPWDPLRGSASGGTAGWEKDADVQEALYQSAQSSATLKMASQSPTIPKRSALDTMIEDLASSLPWLIPSPNGDTLVYIDPPAYQGRQDLDHIVAIRSHLSNPFKIESKRIEDLNSPFFSRLLKGDYQAFTRKRRNLKKLPPEIKYVLDLTPKSEGDEAVQYLEDLSCPAGVLSWASSAGRFQVSGLLVFGRDEFTPQSISHKKRRSTEIKKEAPQTSPVQNHDYQPLPSTSEVAQKSPTTDSQSEQVIVEHVAEPLGEEPEYTQARHRLAIERFLLALQGQDPRFDSAVKVYTTVMVSKAFDIHGQNPLTDYVVRWLYSEPNSCFIEAFPEVTLRMADVIRNQGLASDAFAVIVGEAALDNAMNHFSNDETFFGRRRVAIDETWQSRLEYARPAFTERVQRTFDALAGDRMDWVDNLHTMQLLKGSASGQYASGQSIASGEAYDNLSTLLKIYVQGAIYHILCSQYHSMGSRCSSFNGVGDDLYPNLSQHDKWCKIRPQARIFTWDFWKMLSWLHLEEPSPCAEKHEDLSNLNMVRVNHDYDGLTPNSAEFMGTSLYQAIKYADLAQAVTRCIEPFSDELIEYILGPRERCGSSMCSVHRFNLPLCEICSKPFCATHINPSDHFGYCGGNRDDPTQVQWQDSNSGLHYRAARTTDSWPDPLGEPSAVSIATERPSPKEQKWIGELNSDRHLEAPGELPLASSSEAAKWHDLPGKFPEASGELPTASSFSATKWDAKWLDVLNYGKVESPTRQEDEPPSYQAATQEAPPLPQSSTDSILSKLMGEIRTYIRAIAPAMTTRAQGGQLGEGGTIEMALTSTLVCLGEGETKFFPLWAGGLDDGTSGVYDAQVPLASDGFTGPPASTKDLLIHGLGEEYDMADDRKTVATSAVATDGYGDKLHRNKVYAMSEVDSEDWSFLPKDVGAQTSKERADWYDDSDRKILGSGATTPTGPKTSKEIDILDDVFMEQDDTVSDNDSMGNHSETDDQELNEKTDDDEASSPGSYVLETESVSYGGFSDPETSSVEAATSGYTTRSPLPTPDSKTLNGVMGYSSAQSSNKAAVNGAVANDIGAELKSVYANVYYVYKDGPEEDPLLTRP